MELEEAKNILKRIDIKFFLNGSIEQSNYIIETADKVNKAIEAALQAVENSISKEVIEDKLKELEKQYEEALDENSTKSFILKCQIEGFKEFIKELQERVRSEQTN